MIPCIIPDNIRVRFVSSPSSKAPVFSKFPTLLNCLGFKMPSQYDARSDILRYPYCSEYTLSRRERKKKIDVVFCYLQRIYFRILIPETLFNFFTRFYIFFRPINVQYFRVHTKWYFLSCAAWLHISVPSNTYNIFIFYFSRGIFNNFYKEGVIQFFIVLKKQTYV